MEEHTHFLKRGRCTLCSKLAATIIKEALINPDGSHNWGGRVSFDKQGEMPTMEELDVDHQLGKERGE